MMNMVGSGIELCRNIVGFKGYFNGQTLSFHLMLRFLRVVYIYIYISIFSLGVSHIIL